VPGNPAEGISPRPNPASVARESITAGRVVGILGDHAHTLTAEGHDASEDGTGRGTPVIAFAHTAGLDIQHSTSVTPTIKAGHDTVPSVVYAPDYIPTLTTRAGNTQDDQQTGQLVAFAENQRGELTTSSSMPALKVGGGKPGQGYPAVTDGVIVRRLTPLECERLQGFPDHWTEGQADSQRSKQLGNSVAVPVFEWVGRRLIAMDNHLAGAA
jgi:DNA (cytosine-5)-methyltransferase 1